MAQYTERFSDYIANGKNTYRELFDKFPVFTLGNVNISLYDMFIQYNSFREIGSETEELFEHYLERTVKEALIIFVPKIQLFIDNFMKVLDRKLQLVSSNDNIYYLNPVTSQRENLKIQDKSTVDSVREQSYSYFRSNGQLMQEMIEIENVYEQALRYFDKLFMGVL